MIGKYERVSILQDVLILPMDGCAKLDVDALEALYEELGDRAADEAVCRAMEQIAMQLAQVEAHYRAGEYVELCAPVRAMAAAAKTFGMDELASVGASVVDCALRRDMIAMAAVVQRLMRTGESGLTEIWQAQGMII